MMFTKDGKIYPVFFIAFGTFASILTDSVNSEYMKQALIKVGNPNVLVNLVSRRVRQLTSGTGGGTSRPLLADTTGMGAADIALMEIIEDKMAWDVPTGPEEAEPAHNTPKKKKSKSS